MRTEAKEFMAKQGEQNVEVEEAYKLMEKQLSKAHVRIHRAIYETGQMRTEAKEFMAKQGEQNVEVEEAYKLMEKQLSKAHVNIHQGIKKSHEKDANGKSLRSIKAYAKKDANGKSLKGVKYTATRIGNNPLYQQFVETTVSQTKWQKSSKYRGDQKVLACRHCMEANVEDKTKVWAYVIPKDKSFNYKRGSVLQIHILGYNASTVRIKPCKFCPSDVKELISKGVNKTQKKKD